MTLPLTIVKAIADSAMQQGGARSPAQVLGLTTADNEQIAQICPNPLNGAQVALVIGALASSTKAPWTNVGFNYTGTPAPNFNQSGFNTEAARRSTTLATLVTQLLAAHSPTPGVGGGPNDMSITGNLMTWLAANVA